MLPMSTCLWLYMPGDGQYLPSSGFCRSGLSDSVRKKMEILGSVMAGLILALFPRRQAFRWQRNRFLPSSHGCFKSAADISSYVLLAASEKEACSKHMLPCRYTCPSPSQNNGITNPQLRGCSHLVKKQVWQGDRAWICFVRYIVRNNNR